MTKRSLYNYAQNRDDNEPLITYVLKMYGLHFELLPPGVGADILLIEPPMGFLEIKNPVQPPSKRNLSGRELELQAHCQRHGIPYFVVETPEQMSTIAANFWKREVL